MNKQKNWYKERLLPDNIFFLHRQILTDHINRYKFATKYIKNKSVLDIACGCGYGTSILANAGATKLIGIDNSTHSISYANKRYPHKKIKYLLADAQTIPLKNNSIDTLISFETIEHIRDYKLFLKEIKRVLKKNATVVISTPNEQLKLGDSNKFHFKEFGAEEYKKTIDNYFSDTKYFFQKPINKRFLNVVNKIERHINNNLINCAMDIYLKGIFIDGKVQPLSKLKKTDTPSVLICVAKNI